MALEDLGGLGGFANMAGSGFNTGNLEEQLVEMCKSTLEDLRNNQQQNQRKLSARQQQLLERRKKTDGLTPEQAAKWAELEAAILVNPEFIEPLGLSLAGMIRAKQDTESIIDEFPELQFAMVNFLREKAAEKREAKENAARASVAPAASVPPGGAETVSLNDL
jgi:hypothetical protein